jgi:outer membrane protein
MALLLALLAAPAHALDLLDAYRRARASDPVLAAVDAARLAGHEDVVQARAPLLPQLSAGLALTQTRDPAFEPVQTRSRASNATLTQAIVDVARWSRVRGAQAIAASQDALVRDAEQGLALRVATAYFGVLSALEALANTEANEEAYRQQVVQSDQRYRSGLAAQVNVDQARAYHAQARAGTIAARQALADARAQLAQVAGVRDDEPLKTLRRDLPLAPPDPADRDAWVASALRDNPLLAALQLRVDAAERDVDTARGGHWPTLAATLDVGRPANGPPGDAGAGARTVTTAGVLLNVPLFAGGATQSQVRQALHRRDVARDELEAARRRVARETLDHHGAVVADLGLIEANAAAVDAARQALASTRVGQELGTQTMTDLLLAIQTLTSAQGALAEARHRYVLDGLLLRQSAGRVGEPDLQAANVLLQ